MRTRFLNWPSCVQEVPLYQLECCRVEQYRYVDENFLFESLFLVVSRPLEQQKNDTCSLPEQNNSCETHIQCGGTDSEIERQLFIF